MMNENRRTIENGWCGGRFVAAKRVGCGVAFQNDSNDS